MRLTQTTPGDEHAVVLGTSLETSGEEHEETSHNDTDPTTKGVRNEGCEGDGGQGANVLDGTEKVRRMFSLGKLKKEDEEENALVQSQVGTFRLSEEVDPVGNRLKTVWRRGEARISIQIVDSSEVGALLIIEPSNLEKTVGYEERITSSKMKSKRTRW